MMRTKTIIGELQENKVSQEKVNCIETLLECKKNGIYTIVRNVSTSGMSRNLEFYAIKDNRMFNITFMIGIILEKKLNKNNYLNVSGCGMDMIFATLYNLNSKVARMLQLKEKDYDIYNFIVNTRYNLL